MKEIFGIIFCKETICIQGPKIKRIQAQRAQYNEFVESRLENWAIMSWVAIMVDPNDNKVEIDWFLLKKIILNTIQGDQFLYIFLEFDYKYIFQCYSILLSNFQSPLSRPPFYFILSFPFHLCPPRVDQIVGVDPCHISTFLKSLGSSCKADNYCSGITSSLMQPESQLQNIQCSCSSFPLNIYHLPFVLYVHNVYLYQQNFLEYHPR